MVKRVGVIGGGQLAWMMGGAAQKLGIELIVQTPHADDPAVAMRSSFPFGINAHHTIFAPIDDAAATAQLAQQCDVITFENEFVDLAALSTLEAQGICFYPQLDALQPLLDKYHQRRYLQSIGLPVPQFAALDSAHDNPSFFSLFFLPLFPLFLKLVVMATTVRALFVVHDETQWKNVIQQLQGRSLLVEEFVPFEKELAIMVARSPSGEMTTYPVVETQQVEQVCRRVLVTPLGAQVTQQAQAIAHTLMEKLQVVGIFGIELFLTAEGKVLVNEIAPRTHNSGHFTLDACATSQFEQHLRSVCGLPLGDPTMHCGAAVMVNLLGYESSQHSYHQQREQLARLPHAHVHWYGKAQSRPGRKLGHVTAVLEETVERSHALEIAEAIEKIWYPHQ